MRPATEDYDCCHLCGRAMLNGVCEACDRARHRTLFGGSAWLGGRVSVRMAVVLALVVVTGAVAWYGWWPREVHRPTPTATDRRAVAAGHGLSSSSSAVSFAGQSPSVFGVATDSMDEFGVRGVRGYAFVVSSANGVSELLTDYHLVVDNYLAGRKTLYLEHANESYLATVVAVNPDPHVALLRIDGSWTPLAVARARPAVGQAVLVENSAVAGAEPAAVVRYRGLAGDMHLTFSVPVPAGEDGAPVLNGAGRVVGIAEPTSQFGAAAAGVGFAVPIDAACAAVVAC